MDSTTSECVVTDPEQSQPLRRTQSLPPTRQALFPTPERAPASLETLAEAEHYLQGLGFTVERLAPDQWQIAWPGSGLKIWRYSAEAICQFAQDQAPDYARRAKLVQGQSAPHSLPHLRLRNRSHR